MAGESSNQFAISQAMSANQSDLNLLSSWVGRTVPYGVAVMVTVLVNATTAGVRLDVKAGTRSIQPRSQVQGGGAAGTMPNPLGTAPITFVAYQGEELQLLFYETLGGTPTVNLLIQWDVVG